MSEVMERELGWDDEIERDGREYVLLPEGEYDFTVESYERQRHAGSVNMPPCNKAVLKVRIDTNEGSTIINHQLFLHTKTEGFLSAFFSSIGLKEKGQKARMNWNLVPGSTGKCKVSIREWTGNDGQTHQSNQIDRFLPKERKTVYQPGTF